MSVESWLTLCITPGLGAAGTYRLLDKFGTADAILGASAADLKTAGLDKTVRASIANPDKETLLSSQDWVEGDNHHLLHCCDDRYPGLLLETGQAPVCLFIAGDPDILSMPQLAIVGSRNATPGGCETAREFAAHLAQSGLTITSGLATGIDAAAHRGAIETTGKTVAVLGTGPDTVYPPQNRELAGQISREGALVSEFPPGTPARRDHFPRRNRLMSGLSLGTLVVEEGTRSGALITARYSGDYGREVFAVPGSIHSPLSKGCHRLIRQGAKLVETAADIADELGSLAGSMQSLPKSPADRQQCSAHKDPDYAKLLHSMSHDPVSVGQLAERSGLTAEELSSMLLILELEGRVDSLPGGRFQQRVKVD